MRLAVTALTNESRREWVTTLGQRQIKIVSSQDYNLHHRTDSLDHWPMIINKPLRFYKKDTRAAIQYDQSRMQNFTIYLEVRLSDLGKRCFKTKLIRFCIFMLKPIEVRNFVSFSFSMSRMIRIIFQFFPPEILLNDLSFCFQCKSLMEIQLPD